MLARIVECVDLKKIEPKYTSLNILTEWAWGWGMFFDWIGLGRGGEIVLGVYFGVGGCTASLCVCKTEAFLLNVFVNASRLYLRQVY